MPLTDLDRNLLDRCLAHEPRAWQEFVDRFLGVLYHVVHHSAHMRSMPISEQDVEDLAYEVLEVIVADDFRVLRQFRRRSSLASYLTVVARRVVVNRMARKAAQQLRREIDEPPSREAAPDRKLELREEVEALLAELSGREADVVRKYYLEHKSYAEISAATGIPENTIGPMLSRVRERLRKAVPKS